MPPKSMARQESINPLENEYIPPAYLPNLRKYKYSSTDLSIVSRYVLQRYWNFVVNLVPMTIAPNCITFTGFLIGMSSTALLLYYYFFEEGVYPSWCLYYAAFALFAYQTLDAIDGKQARRTGTGSPLGELFDHGCDAFLTPLVLLNVSLATYMTSVERFWLSTISSMSLFTVIWEQFSTGTFDLGYVNGPAEGIILNCVLFIVSGVYGKSIWDISAVGPYDVAYPPVLSPFFPGCSGTVHIESVRSVLFILFLISCPFTILVNVVHTVLRPTVHASKVTPMLALAPIITMTALVVHVFVVFPNLTVRFPFAMEISYGLLMSITVTRLTLSRLSAMPYRTVNWHIVLFFLALAAASAMHYAGDASVSHDVVETVLGWTLTGLSVFAAMQYGHMILSAFTQIARYLSISIMTIKPNKSD
ncbi:putative choline/ethanolamine phosphotransferase (CEPT) [Leishmania major strain Friedlin]|uniref:Putative choline/ethanolamine phosphotransferase (CEPT) n=1 Tax=Leishmania major TaxID=5664 RepID=Q4Q0H0_LEIMA|nr:putative choline/ethanolamine phosphotransferase (CEPT) [Leishmania major strain Friedlin]CAG9584145.1 choline/ethanolamine_phosphotransferase_-_putative [Leishmania major strain Friedlin]CAJ09565.1 putative choline/ethanolamine phosphotransferase (CEPT) [Leishmania major strain Friedlin]|eukprot:XP_001687178.1 putative choline/ethanolamine phosphotransferase (CEPT) [Leishmania major strain Friedlin]